MNEIYGDLNALVIEQGERLGTNTTPTCAFPCFTLCITDIIENNMASVDDKVETGVKQLANASHYQVSCTQITSVGKPTNICLSVCAVQGAQQGVLSDGSCGDYCSRAHRRPRHTTQELICEQACICHAVCCVVL